MPLLRTADELLGSEGAAERAMDGDDDVSPGEAVMMARRAASAFVIAFAAAVAPAQVTTAECGYNRIGPLTGSAFLHASFASSDIGELPNGAQLQISTHFGEAIDSDGRGVIVLVCAECAEPVDVAHSGLASP